VPTWGQILKEVSESARARAPQGPDLDGIRLKYIQQLHKASGRAVISYASGWLNKHDGRTSYSVEGQDVHGLMEVCYGVQERELDLILHSPGGSAQAAEQMIEYLRTRFDYIRAIVPLQAKSAATMIALGCDEVVMGDHSELGPIDPQILVPVPEGTRYAPAHAILRDFGRAKIECQENVSSLAAWTPILRSYAGGLIEFCHQQVRLRWRS
jgi:ClpP class serine protease